MKRRSVLKSLSVCFIAMLMLMTGFPTDNIFANASEYLGECCYCSGAVYDGMDCKCGMEGTHHCEEFDCYMDNHCMNCGNGCGEEMGMLDGSEDGWCPIGGPGSHCVGCLLDVYGFKECPTCGEEYCPICNGEGFEDYGCETCLGCMNCWHHCAECGKCDQEEDFCYECGLCMECCLDQELHCPNCYGCFQDYEYCDICGYCDNCIDGWHCENCGYCHDGNTDAVCDICGMCEYCPDYGHCPDCGRCFEEIDKCDTCGLCVECCEDYAYSMGCDCGDWVCVEDPRFSEHLASEHTDAHHSAKPSPNWSFDAKNHWKNCRWCSDSAHVTSRGIHNFNKDGICSVCGYRSDGGIAILEQPTAKVVTCSVDTTDETDPYHMKNNTVTFHTKAYCENKGKSKALHYEWEITFDGGRSTYKLFYEREGKTAWGIFTDTLTYGVDSDICKYTGGQFCAVRCHITDGKFSPEDKYNVYTQWARIIPQHNYKVIQVGYNGHYFKCKGDCGAMILTVPHEYGPWKSESYGSASAVCNVCGYVKRVPKHTHFYDQDTIEAYKTDYGSDGFEAEVEDDVNGSYLYRLKSNKNIYFGANKTSHFGTCGKKDCEHPVTEDHEWIYNTSVDDYSTSGKLIYRICSICGYEDVFQENGIWEIGSHVMVYTDCSGSHTVAKDGDTVQLFRKKIPGKVFDHWEIEADHLVGAPKERYYRRDPIPEGYLNTENDTLLVKDAISMGKWYVTAVMKTCDHLTDKGELNYKLVNVRTADCTHFGYSGDKVCKVCGELLEPGDTSIPTGHGEAVPAVEDVLQYNRWGEVLYNKEGDPLYLVRAASEGNCQTKGYTGDMVCSICGDVLERGKEVSGQHTFRYLQNISYACKYKDHQARHSKWCTVCNLQAWDLLGEIHDPQNIQTVNVIEAGCTTKGYTGDVYCSACNMYVSYGKETAPTGHDWSTVTTTPATTTSTGLLSKTCSKCGMHKDEVTIPKLSKNLKFSFDIPTDYQSKEINVSTTSTKFKIRPYSEADYIFFTASKDRLTDALAVKEPFVPGKTYYALFIIEGLNYNSLYYNSTRDYASVLANGERCRMIVNTLNNQQFVLAPFTIPKTVMKGDVNRDGFVDLSDYSDLAKYFAEWSDYDEIVDVEAADLNGSGGVDLDDLSILAKYFAEWTGYEDYLT